MKRYDILFGLGKFAQWSDLVKLVDLDCSQELRISRLSREHVELPVGRNMNVKLAAQTFSGSSAAAIRTFVRLGLMREEALSTAEFMDCVNKVFDMGNGTSPNAPTNKAALHKDNLMAKVADLQLHADWIGSWRFFQRSNKKETHCHQFHIGWQVALRAMSELSPLLLKAGLLFVPLRRLGQDHIENLFCCIRGRNRFNDRPEYSAFWPAIRACALSSMLKPVNDSNNCETDGDSLLVSILEKATSDCRAGRARHAAATATALARSIIGDVMGDLGRFGSVAVSGY